MVIWWNGRISHTLLEGRHGYMAFIMDGQTDRCTSAYIHSHSPGGLQRGRWASWYRVIVDLGIDTHTLHRSLFGIWAWSKFEDLGLADLITISVLVWARSCSLVLGWCMKWTFFFLSFGYSLWMNGRKDFVCRWNEWEDVFFMCWYFLVARFWGVAYDYRLRLLLLIPR